MSTGTRSYETVAVDREKHRIEKTYKKLHTDELFVDQSGSIVMSHDSDGTYLQDSSEYRCRCGEEFETFDETNTHLRKIAKQANRYPMTAAPDMFRFGEQYASIGGGMIEGPLSKDSVAVLVESGREYYITAARHSFTPPEDYSFETWGPLQPPDRDTPGAGKLWNGRAESPLFREKVLKRAVATVTDRRPSYDPDRVSMHTDGHTPALVECGEKAVLIAPQKFHI